MHHSSATTTCRHFVLSIILMIISTQLCPAALQDDNTYQIFFPADNDQVPDQFNFVVRRTDGLRPGTLEISTGTDFKTCAFRSDAWVEVSGWWQLAMSSSILRTGTYYWRINDSGTVSATHPFIITSTGNPVGYDPVGYPAITVGEGASKHHLSLQNLWLRTKDSDASFGYDVNIGYISAPILAYGGYVYLPELKMPAEYATYANNSNYLIPQKVRILDARTGADVKTVELTFVSRFPITNNRRYDQIGTDNAGNVWMASSYSTIAEANDFLSTNRQGAYYQYMTQVYDPKKGAENLNTTACIRLFRMDMSDPLNPFADRQYVLAIPDNRTSTLTDRRIVSDVTVWGDIQSDGSFRVTAQYSEFNSPDSPLRIYSWTVPNNGDGKIISPTLLATLSDVAGCQAHASFVDVSTAWVKGSDRAGAPQPAHLIRTGSPSEVIASTPTTIFTDIDESERFSGNAICAFTHDGLNFIVHNSRYDNGMVQFTLYNIPDYSSAIPEVNPVILFPQNGLETLPHQSYRNYANPISGIYTVPAILSSGPALRASASAATDIYIHNPFGGIGAYRLQNLISTDASDISINTGDVTWTHDGKFLTCSDPDGIIHIYNIAGQHLTTGSTGYADISALGHGVYIARCGHAVHRFLVR